MIINLHGLYEENGNIKFDLPIVYFTGKHKIHVNELGILWKNNITNVSGILTSTLVDMSPLNPKQQLLFFHVNKESNYTFITPTRPQQYKIQCQSLHDSFFTLFLSEKHEIENIYLQLEVTDERVQQIRQRPL